MYAKSPYIFVSATLSRTVDLLPSVTHTLLSTFPSSSSICLSTYLSIYQYTSIYLSRCLATGFCASTDLSLSLSQFICLLSLSLNISALAFSLKDYICTDRQANSQTDRQTDGRTDIHHHPSLSFSVRLELNQIQRVPTSRFIECIESHFSGQRFIFWRSLRRSETPLFPVLFFCLRVCLFFVCHYVCCLSLSISHAGFSKCV